MIPFITIRPTVYGIAILNIQVDPLCQLLNNIVTKYVVGSLPSHLCLAAVNDLAS
jgi:hypothetical protein